MQTTKHTNIRQLGAVIKYESNPDFTRGKGEFTNSGTVAVQLQPGTIFTGGDTPAVFDTANVAAFTGINTTAALVQPGAKVFVAWLARGEAIVNANEVDFPADAGQTTVLKAAMTDLGIKLVDGLDA